jgi:hypothetical protein
LRHQIILGPVAGGQLEVPQAKSAVLKLIRERSLDLVRALRGPRGDGHAKFIANLFAVFKNAVDRPISLKDVGALAEHLGADTCGPSLLLALFEFGFEILD